jgi:hypothetical protein
MAIASVREAFKQLDFHPSLVGMENVKTALEAVWQFLIN